MVSIARWQGAMERICPEMGGRFLFHTKTTFPTSMWVESYSHSNKKLNCSSCIFNSVKEHK